MNPKNEVFKHSFGDFEISYHSILHGTNSLDVVWGAANHLFGVGPYSYDTWAAPQIHLDGNNGGLGKNDTPAADVYKGIRRPQVNSHVV
jgi:hypothetical protein